MTQHMTSNEMNTHHMTFITVTSHDINKSQMTSHMTSGLRRRRHRGGALMSTMYFQEGWFCSPTNAIRCHSKSPAAKI
eukprot:CAMPEP_0113848380 /NCGR_PEP_ID=MMETSP0372-20130328/2445_1 /TAXON_ID=340204 /ORGANISM="Lankesteria abbotti" /LENGTH=77 /DNA_ID=CAMNT_0000817857 /DNA_START=804 /DNA_END=1037 /DNA_ORIENTATION=- /assembly_acc=CAM_ASM_000359